MEEVEKKEINIESQDQSQKEKSKNKKDVLKKKVKKEVRSDKKQTEQNKSGGHKQFFRLSTLNEKSLEGMSSNSLSIKQNIMKDKFQLSRFYSQGTYGPIFFGKQSSNNHSIVIKFYDSHLGKLKTQFYNTELHVLSLLKQLKMTGFPLLINHGFHQEMNMEYIVLDKCDIDLETLFFKLHKKLQKQTILNVGIQLVERVEKLHGLGFVHNDIKPQNILVSRTQNHLTLIDFTISTQIPQSLDLYEEQKNQQSIYKGNPTFVSNGTLLGKKPTMKDDLESITYTILYLMLGNLPWQEQPSTSKNALRPQKVLKETDADFVPRMIELRDPYNLCINLDSEMLQFTQYCQNLSRTKKPDYKFLKNLLETLKRKQGLNDEFEWYEDYQMKEKGKQIQAQLSQVQINKSNILDEIKNPMKTTELQIIEEEKKTKTKAKRRRSLVPKQTFESGSMLQIADKRQASQLKKSEDQSQKPIKKKKKKGKKLLKRKTNNNIVVIENKEQEFQEEYDSRNQSQIPSSIKQPQQEQNKEIKKSQQSSKELESMNEREKGIYRIDDKYQFSNKEEEDEQEESKQQKQSKNENERDEDPFDQEQYDDEEENDNDIDNREIEDEGEDIQDEQINQIITDHQFTIHKNELKQIETEIIHKS